jgi:hypothetical protein
VVCLEACFILVMYLKVFLVLVTCFAIAYLFVMCLNHVSKVMPINIVLQFGDVNELQLLFMCRVWKRVLFR